MTIRTIINNHISFGNWEGRVKKVYKTKGTGEENGMLPGKNVFL